MIKRIINVLLGALVHIILQIKYQLIRITFQSKIFFHKFILTFLLELFCKFTNNFLKI
jgi:hypothetical protein